MTHQQTQLLSRVGSGPVGVCVIGLQLEFFLHSSLIPDVSVGARPPTTQQLSWVGCCVMAFTLLKAKATESPRK